MSVEPQVRPLLTTRDRSQIGHSTHNKTCSWPRTRSEDAGCCPTFESIETSMPTALVVVASYVRMDALVVNHHLGRRFAERGEADGNARHRLVADSPRVHQPSRALDPLELARDPQHGAVGQLVAD